ncbi:hypothetical protein GCM10017776_14960 [Streptomyces griseoluteus]|nr:hypothetical protein GCM10017776_14960 [Streptomyces griseoluteus]
MLPRDAEISTVRGDIRITEARRGTAESITRAAEQAREVLHTGPGAPSHDAPRPGRDQSSRPAPILSTGPWAACAVNTVGRNSSSPRLGRPRARRPALARRARTAQAGPGWMITGPSG